MEFIILTQPIEYQVDARHLIKSVLKNELGDPILRSDLIPRITDQTIHDNLNSITDTEDVLLLPDVGEQVIIDKLYVYSSEFESNTIKCRQTHNRTIYDPIDIPNLFSFYRGELDENGNPFEWIQNEEIKIDWKRTFGGKTYICAQPHMTVEGQTPDLTPALWNVWTEPNTIIDWYQPTGAHDAFRINDLVRYTDGKVYKSLIDYNTYSPIAYPAGWELQPDLS